MGYKVIEHFCDMLDNGRSYEVGDPYPRSGLSVSKSRYDALATMSNALGRPLIEKEKENEKEEEPIVVEEPTTAPAPKVSRGRKKKE